jgi:uncharacterized small protein (DUF1192 family)
MKTRTVKTAASTSAISTSAIETQLKAAYQARIAQLEAELAKKTTAKKSALAFKVSPKGAVSVYNMGRFPVTLYAEQQLRFAKEGFGLTDEQIAKSPIGKFITANKANLSFKSN